MSDSREACSARGGMEAAVEDLREDQKTAHYLEKFKKQETKVFKANMRVCFEHTDDLLKEIDLLHQITKALLLHDIGLMVKEKIFYRVWKATVYKFVNAVRTILPAYPAEKFNLIVFLQKLIDKALSYFRSMLSTIQDFCEVTPDAIRGHSIFRWRDETKDCLVYSQYAKECVAKILVLMGDIHRYSYTNPSKLQQSFECYELARLAAPEKGRTYHQLNVIATKLGDYIDEIYYLTRASLAGEPEDVKQQLNIIYDDTYKLYKKIERECWYSKGKTNERFLSRHFRKERWLFTVGHEKLPPPPEDPPTKEEHIQSLSAPEVYRRFSLTYAQFIGKIYTHIGLDSLNIVAEEALVYFEGLLKIGSKELTPRKIIHIMALNMFIVDFTNDKVKQQPHMKQLKTDSLNFVMEMFGLVCEKVSKILYLGDFDNPILESLSIGLETWCEWMDVNWRDWPNKRPRAVFSVRRAITTKYDNERELEDENWIEYAKLMTILEIVIRKLAKKLFPSVSRKECSVKTVPLCPLLECSELNGFSKFTKVDILKQQFFIKNDSKRSKRLAEIYVRLKNVHAFGFSVYTQTDILTAEKSFYKCLVFTNKRLALTPKNDAEICGIDQKSYHFYTAFNNPPQLPEQKKKKTRRVPLVRRPDCNNCRIIVRRNEKIRDSKVILPTFKGMLKYEEWLYHSNRNYYMTIIVQPLRLVIDTNCFIQKFEFVRMLISLVTKPIYLPVSVILELKGLSRGGLTVRDRKKYGSIHNPEAREKLLKNKEVAVQCKKSLRYINDNMNCFIVVTSTGRRIFLKSPWDFVKDDYYDPTKTNDERIVDTCKYLESHDVLTRSMDCQRHIYRKTVLISGDTNLRLTMSTMDIPARPIHAFVIWFHLMLKPELLSHIVEGVKYRASLRNKFFRARRRRVQAQRVASRVDSWPEFRILSPINRVQSPPIQYPQYRILKRGEQEDSK